MTAKSQSKEKIKTLYLSPEILEEAEKALCRYVQQKYFAAEIKILESNQEGSAKWLKKCSKLCRLDPFLEVASCVLEAAWNKLTSLMEKNIQLCFHKDLQSLN